MSRRFLRAAFTRLPPVARRDQRIAELTGSLAGLRKQEQRLKRELAAQTQKRPPVRPSYATKLHSEQRLSEHGRPGNSAIIGQGKLWARDFARSHGVDTPAELGRWDDPHDIAWDDLPDLVVVKADHGSTSRGVIPLRRLGSGWQTVTLDDRLTGPEIATYLASRVEEGTAEPPFFAEEFLDEDGTGSRPPMDIKVYTFYGEAPLALLRRADQHGVGASARFRLIDREGRDVVQKYARAEVDHSLEVPDAFDQVLDVAARLSIPIRAPFMRIDLYRVGGRVVWGEATPRPGADLRNFFPPELDEELGDAWERAEVRLAHDIAEGAPAVPVLGPVPLDQGASP